MTGRGGGRRMLMACAGLLAACSGSHRHSAGPEAQTPLAARLAMADPRRGARLFGQCAACHTVHEGAGDRDGPNLYAVIGRPVGRGSSPYAYTAALQAVGGVWTVQKLDAWLTDPARFVPGTSMGFPGLRDGMERADVIAFLNENGSNQQLSPPPRAGGH